MRPKAAMAFSVLGLLLTAQPLPANNEFQQWMQQQQQGVKQQKQAFLEYRDARDKEFTAFLKAQWKPVDLLKGDIPDESPKPVVMPVAPAVPELPDTESPVNLPEQSQKPVTIRPTPIIEPVVEPEPSAKPPGNIVKDIPAETAGRPLLIDFYGRKIRLYYDPGLSQRIGVAINKDSISQYWSVLSQQDYESLVTQLRQQQTALELNDWALAGLVHQAAAKIAARRNNETALLSWFLLIKAGYQARVAYDQSMVYLLVPSDQELFEVAYFTFDGIRYYAVDFNGNHQKPGRVYTYDGRYPGASRQFDMRVGATVAASEHTAERRLSFQFEGKTYQIRVNYDQGRVSFFENYPQLGLKLYFESGVNQETASPLQQQLAAYMQGMTEQQAVNFLLRFVQTAFAYQTDEQQFGEENYLFPEETLFYPYSDCEDRSVLFAWLVRSLLRLDVIGLDYPGHVATAVRFNTDVSGDSVIYNAQKYTVTDPTYINAVAGMTMPEFKGSQPDIIRF